MLCIYVDPGRQWYFAEGKGPRFDPVIVTGRVSSIVKDEFKFTRYESASNVLLIFDGEDKIQTVDMNGKNVIYNL